MCLFFLGHTSLLFAAGEIEDVCDPKCAKGIEYFGKCHTLPDSAQKECFRCELNFKLCNEAIVTPRVQRKSDCDGKAGDLYRHCDGYTYKRITPTEESVDKAIIGIDDIRTKGGNPPALDEESGNIQNAVTK